MPTVSIYTIQDDIIQPEIINPTSVLPGAASSVSVQELCGLTYLADHFTYVLVICMNGDEELTASSHLGFHLRLPLST